MNILVSRHTQFYIEQEKVIDPQEYFNGNSEVVGLFVKGTIIHGQQDQTSIPMIFTLGVFFRI